MTDLTGYHDTLNAWGAKIDRHLSDAIKHAKTIKEAA